MPHSDSLKLSMSKPFTSLISSPNHLHKQLIGRKKSVLQHISNNLPRINWQASYGWGDWHNDNIVASAAAGLIWICKRGNGTVLEYASIHVHATLLVQRCMYRPSKKKISLYTCAICVHLERGVVYKSKWRFSKA